MRPTALPCSLLRAPGHAFAVPGHELLPMVRRWRLNSGRRPRPHAL